MSVITFTINDEQLSAREGETAAVKKAGYALLDMYIKSFQEMATQGFSFIRSMLEKHGIRRDEARARRSGSRPGQ